MTGGEITVCHGAANIAVAVGDSYPGHFDTDPDPTFLFDSAPNLNPTVLT